MTWWQPLVAVLDDESLTAVVSIDGTGIAVTNLTCSRQLHRIRQTVRDLQVDTSVKANATTIIIEKLDLDSLNCES